MLGVTIVVLVVVGVLTLMFTVVVVVITVVCDGREGGDDCGRRLLWGPLA